MRIILLILFISAAGLNTMLFTLWQNDEKQLHDTAQERVQIYDSARQIIADLKANDPETFTNVVVPVEVQAPANKISTAFDEIESKIK